MNSDNNNRDNMNKCSEVEHSILKKFRKPIWNQFTKALKIYHLIDENDKIAVCISGGKDSFLMAKLFQEIHRHSDFPFELEFICMDPGYTLKTIERIKFNAELLNIDIKIFESDIFYSVFNIEKNPCYICARMRRGYLYSFAKKLGCNKIALAHHYDDVIETSLMSMLYGAQIQSMLPKLKSTNYEGMQLIRPLYLIRESDILKWVNYNELEFINCACKFTEKANKNEYESLSKRKEIKNLISYMKKTNPDVEKRIFKSMENVCLDTVLGYKSKGEYHYFLDEF